MSIQEYFDEQDAMERTYAPCDQAAAERRRAEDDALPACACGCGQTARLVADVVFATGANADDTAITSIDCRAPWVDIEHALGAQEETERPTIDVVVPPEDFQRILAAAPCWCGMAKHTTLFWCPLHGAKE